MANEQTTKPDCPYREIENFHKRVVCPHCEPNRCRLSPEQEDRVKAMIKKYGWRSL